MKRAESFSYIDSYKVDKTTEWFYLEVHVCTT